MIKIDREYYMTDNKYDYYLCDTPYFFKLYDEENLLFHINIHFRRKLKIFSSFDIITYDNNKYFKIKRKIYFVEHIIVRKN